MARQNHKFRIYPTKIQVEKLQSSLDLCRELYNAAIQERRDAWKLNRINISFFDQSRQVPEIRSARPDFMSIQSRICYRVLTRVNTTFQTFFRRVKSGQRPGFPRFKKASQFNSFAYNREGFRFLENKLRLANIGMVKIKQHRDIVGKVKEVTVKREGSKWFVIVACDDVPAIALPKVHSTVGVDMGIESFATLSDGTQIANWRFYDSMAQRLRIAQRRVARRKKGSNRRRKAVAILRNLHQQIFNQRHDFQHKLSTTLVNKFDVISIENLNTKGMSRGILAKQIHDASWGSFFQKLKYKAENAGRKLIEVNPAYTSQTCSACGVIEKKSLSERMHHCPCGLSIHRDHNAALNILALGLSVQPLTSPVTECVG